MKNVTKADLLAGLRALGVRPGDVLEVHSSLRSFGHVEGGAETVVSALKEAVTEEGTLFMPALRLSPPVPLTDEDRSLGLTSRIRILPPDAPRTAMGAIADLFRVQPGTVVSDGVFRVAAWGRHAGEALTGGLDYVLANNGHALLMGVDIYRLTAMHYVEDALPQRVRDVFAPSAEALRRYPENEWLIEAGEPSIKAWYTIQDRASARGLIQETRVGASRWMVLPVRDVTELYRQALLTEGSALYGL